MRLVAISRIRNEADIVESWLRHHAALVDHHIVLDNASTDATPAILRALRAEGLPLTLLTSEAAIFAEQPINTALARHAAALGAEWILPLDADEFLDPAALAAPLADVLDTLPARAPCVRVAMVDHQPVAEDEAAETVVPVRQGWRQPHDNAAAKVFVRGLAVARGAEITAGNHAAVAHGGILPAVAEPRLRLRHYWLRSGWQLLAKVATGRLKVLAAGGAALRDRSNEHYTETFGHLRDRPHWLLGDPDFLAARRPLAAHAPPLVHDPLRYLGGALQYTAAADPALAALTSTLAVMEAIARQHGELADAEETTRRLIEARAATIQPMG